jgi:hypothetical protein
MASENRDGKENFTGKIAAGERLLAMVDRWEEREDANDEPKTCQTLALLPLYGNLTL